MALSKINICSSISTSMRRMWLWNLYDASRKRKWSLFCVHIDFIHLKWVPTTASMMLDNIYLETMKLLRVRDSCTKCGWSLALEKWAVSHICLRILKLQIQMIVQSSTKYLRIQIYQPIRFRTDSIKHGLHVDDVFSQSYTFTFEAIKSTNER